MKYLKFLTKASNQHGVHSPFVYHLVTKCFYQKTDINLWQKFLTAKQEVLNSKISTDKGLSNKKAKLLIRLIDYFKPVSVLEISNSSNLVNTAIKVGNPNSSIISIKKISKVDKEFNFIYFNKNKSKKELLNYFNSYLSTASNDSIWVFDTIYINKEIQEAWLEIKNNEKVRVTVDLFFWGIVFFRKEQAKEHFKIRV